MNILAVDPGTKRMGWCLRIDDGPLSVGYFSMQGDWPERRKALRNYLREVFQVYCRAADVLAIEDPYSVNILTAKRLATVKAMVEEVATHHGLSVFEVTPQEWRGLVRRRLQLDKNADVKAEAIKEASRRCERTLQEDEAAAYWVATWFAENAHEVGK